MEASTVRNRVRAPYANEGLEGESSLADFIYGLDSGFWTARCLHVVAELGVADHIGDEAQTITKLANATGAEPNALGRVMRLLAMHDVFAGSAGRYRHTPASRLLRSDHPQSVRAWVRLHGSDVFWRCSGELLASVKTGATAMSKVFPGGIFGYLRANADFGRLFDDAMTSKSHAQIAATVPAYDFSGFKRIVDVGGGRGHLLSAVLRANLDAHGILFDLPEVIAAQAPENLLNRVQLLAGDFFKEPLPEADAYLLSNVIHDWADEESVTILSAIRRAISGYGKVLLFEAVIPDGSEPHPGKLLDVSMLAITGGREREIGEYDQLLVSAGFKMARVIDTRSSISIIEAVPV